MEKNGINRRAFLEASAMGAVLVASGALLKTSAAGSREEKTMKIFVCSVCGHVEFGSAPDACPVCHAPKEKFNQNDDLFTDAESADKGGEAAHTPEIAIIKHSKLIREQQVREVMVRIGKVLHPMEEAHHIQWIDCYVDDQYVSRIFLTPGVNPAVNYYPKINGSKVRIVEHCNLHGHWQAEVNL